MKLKYFLTIILFTSIISVTFALPQISNTVIKTRTQADSINVKGAETNVGNVSIQGNANNAEITTNVSAGNITTKKNANIGNISVKKIKNAKLTTKVILGNESFKKNISIGTISTGSSSEQNIGTISIENGARIKEASTQVGGSFTDKIKAKHKAKLYSDNDGVDARGIKNVYVSKKEYKKAMRKKQSIGNVKLNKKDKGANVFVETGKRSKKSSDEDDEDGEW